MGNDHGELQSEQPDVEEDIDLIASFVSDAYHDLQKRAENPRVITGMPTGFEELDELIDGLHRGALILVCGRPCMGKSAFAINLAINAAKDSHSVALLTAGMTVQQTSLRMLAAEANVEINTLHRANLTMDDWRHLSVATNTLGEARMLMDDQPASLSDIQSMYHRLKHSEPGLDLLVVDDLQSLAERIGIKQSIQEKSTIIHVLKKIAQELEIAAVVTSHIKPIVESRFDKRPRISDMYAASTIEQKADVIMFLYRDEIYNRKPDNEGLAEIIVAKQNHGKLSNVNLIFKTKIGRFDDLGIERNRGTV